MTIKRESPFSALEALRDKLPAGETPAREKPGREPPKPKAPARAVVRMERKQRGGKEVTVVDKLELGDTDLALWCEELKQALGCGGTVDGRTIVLQGDLERDFRRC